MHYENVDCTSFSLLYEQSVMSSRSSISSEPSDRSPESLKKLEESMKSNVDIGDGGEFDLPPVNPKSSLSSSTKHQTSSPLGFRMGNPRVRFSRTAPVP